VPHLDDKHSPSLLCLQLFEQFLANVGNNLLIVSFKILYDSWVIAVDSLRVQQKEVRWSKVCGSWWLMSTPDHAITTDVLLENCCYCCMGSHPILFHHHQNGGGGSNSNKKYAYDNNKFIFNTEFQRKPLRKFCLK